MFQWCYFVSWVENFLCHLSAGFSVKSIATPLICKIVRCYIKTLPPISAAHTITAISLLLTVNSVIQCLQVVLLSKDKVMQMGRASQPCGNALICKYFKSLQLFPVRAGYAYYPSG